MRLTRTFVGLIVLLSIITLARAGSAELSDHIVFEQGETLCGRIGAAGPVEQLSDRAHYEKVDRDGRRWYVLLRFDSRRSWLKILECNSAGVLHSVRAVVDAQLLQTTAIDQAQFLPDGRLLVILHVNPSHSAAVALNCQTGDRTILLGHTFTPDPTGRHIAYFREPPAESQKSGIAELWVDGKKACDIPAIQATGITWTSTGTAVASH